MLLTGFGWLVWLIVGLVVGAAAGALLHRRDPDAAGQVHLTPDRALPLLFAVLGAFVGGLLASQLPVVLATDLNPLGLPAALIGALAAVGVLAVLRRRSRRPAVTADTITPSPVHAPTLRHRTLPISRAALFAAILFIPVLDLLLLGVRFPALSTIQPPFGVVETYQSEHGQLDYLVYAPPTDQPDAARPLLVLLHGCMQDPVILETASAMTRLADANNFLLVYPQQNFISSPHRCWNWYDPRNQVRDSGEPALLTGIVSAVEQAYAVDAQRIYAAGISSGGAMTSILGSCYRDVFAAAAVHSGMAYKSAISLFQAPLAPLRGNQVPPDSAGRDAFACSAEPSRPMPLVILHGAADTIVFPINADHTLQQFVTTNDLADDGSANGSVPSQPTRTESAQIPDGYRYTIEDYDAADGLLIRRYLIDGLWHMWSGGTGILPLSDPNAPDAGTIFWDFLSAYRLS